LVLGMNVEASILVPDGTAYAIDACVAAVMLVRGDVMVEGWSNPWAGEFAVRARTRFGLGVLREQRTQK